MPITISEPPSMLSPPTIIVLAYKRRLLLKFMVILISFSPAHPKAMVLPVGLNYLALHM